MSPPLDPFESATAEWEAALAALRDAAGLAKARIDTEHLRAHTLKSSQHAMVAGRMAREHLTKRAEVIRQKMLAGHEAVGLRKSAKWTSDSFTAWANSRINEEAANLKTLWAWSEGRAAYEAEVGAQRTAEHEATRSEFTRHFNMKAGWLPYMWRGKIGDVVGAITRLFGGHA